MPKPRISWTAGQSKSITDAFSAYKRRFDWYVSKYGTAEGLPVMNYDNIVNSIRNRDDLRTWVRRLNRFAQVRSDGSLMGETEGDYRQWQPQIDASGNVVGPSKWVKNAWTIGTKLKKRIEGLRKRVLEYQEDVNMFQEEINYEGTILREAKYIETYKRPQNLQWLFDKWYMSSDLGYAYTYLTTWDEYNSDYEGYEEVKEIVTSLIDDPKLRPIISELFNSRMRQEATIDYIYPKSEAYRDIPLPSRRRDVLRYWQNIKKNIEEKASVQSMVVV